MGFWYASHSGGGGSTNLLGIMNIPWKEFREKTFIKIEAYAGTEEHLMRYLAIEEALQREMKEILEHNNHLYLDWCDPSDK